MPLEASATEHDAAGSTGGGSIPFMVRVPSLLTHHFRLCGSLLLLRKQRQLPHTSKRGRVRRGSAIASGLINVLVSACAVCCTVVDLGPGGRHPWLSQRR